MKTKKQITKSNTGKIKLAQEDTELTGAEALSIRSGLKAGRSFAPASFAPSSFLRT